MGCADIPTRLLNDRRNDLFLLFDSGLTSESRFIIFSSKKKQEMFDERTPLIIDGTFKIVPSGFFQLMTVIGKHFNRFYPIFYVLMSDKSENSYREVFSKVVEIFPLSPISVTTDFEFALLSSTTSSFDNVTGGCFFHFTQSVWRKIQVLGLTFEYKTNNSFKRMIKRLCFLAFFNVDEVLDAFIYLEEEFDKNFNDPRHQEFLCYFKQNYIGSNINDSRFNIDLSTARFRISVWNIRNRLLSGCPYTSNNLESWHNKLRERSGINHPNIARFIVLLNDLDTDDLFSMERSFSGKLNWENSATYLTLNEKLKKIVGFQPILGSIDAFFVCLEEVYKFKFE